MKSRGVIVSLVCAAAALAITPSYTARNTVHKARRLTVAPATRATAMRSTGLEPARTPTPKAAPVRSPAMQAVLQVPLDFEANQGQAPAAYAYVAHGPSYALGVSATGLALELHRPAAEENAAAGDTPGPEDSSRLRLQLVGANRNASVTGQDPLPGRSNYFIGNDPAQWQRSVPHVRRVKIAQAYPGIDLVLYGNRQQLEYDFAVAPGVDPHRIALSTEGAQGVAIDGAGNAVLRTPTGTVELKRPVAYQEVDGVRKTVESSFHLSQARTLAFNVGKYDRTRPLVIDPVLLYGVSLGGSFENTGMGLAFDASGNTYVTGHTCSADFPSTGGSYQTFPNNPTTKQCDAAFVLKMDPTGSTLIYSDFIGGTGVSTGSHLAVDSSGNVYLAGATGALNFATVGNIGPTAPAPCGLSGAGFNCSQGFILKLSPDGSQLLFSSLLGGNQASFAYQAKLNPVTGDLDVLGATNATNFLPAPTTLETSYGGGTCSGGNPCVNGFLLGLDPATGKLRYGTYIGGAKNNLAAGLAFDKSGNIYVAGSTQAPLSTSLGTVTQTYAPSGGATAAGTSLFVLKLNLSGTTLTPGYLTLVEGEADTGASSLAIDGSGNAYFGGATAATHLPVTTGVFQATNKATGASNCNWGAAITSFLPTACGTGLVGELNPAGALTFLTYLGGSTQDMVEAVGVDSTGNIWITGVTSSFDFPFSADKYNVAGLVESPFLAEMSNSGATLPFATLIAGDEGQSTDLQIDSSNNIYVTGNGVAPPSTPGTYPANPAAFGSLYLQKWGEGPEPSITISPSLFIGFNAAPIGGVSAPQTVTIQNTGTGTMTLGLQLTPVFSTTPISDFLMSSNCGTTLAGGASCALTLTFAPGPYSCSGSNCFPTQRTASIYVTSNAPQGQQLIELSGTAAVGAAVSIVPNPVVFPAQAAGTASAAIYDEVGSDGDTPLTITKMALGGPNASDFTFVTAGLGGNDCQTTPLQPGSLCNVQLNFNPPASATGTRTATLTFTDNAADSPQTLNITGTVAAASDLTISPASLAIGPVAIGTSQVGQLTLLNPSTNSIQIASLGLSGTNAGDYSTALAACSGTTLPVTIAAGAKCLVNVTFNPAAGASGQRTATLTVGTSPAITGLPTVALVGDAVTNSQPTASTFEVPDPMNFGGLQVGQASNNASVLFSISNKAPIPCAGGAGSCGAPLVISSITPGLSDYTLTGQGATCTSFPLTIPVQSGCTFAVVFTPTQAGSRNTTLTIASNDPQGTVTLPLYGSGLSVPLAVAQQTALNFGNSAIGVASPPLTTTLQNTGQSPLTISAVTPSANFAVTANTCTAALAPNATCTLTVTFTPPSAGYFTGTLTIADNDAIGAQQTVTMTGTGATGPQVRITPATLNFGNQTLNVASAPQTVTLTGTGDTAVAFPANAVRSSADFILTGTTCATSLAFGATCTASVEFKPTTTQLPEMGTLLFADNAGGNPQPVYMTGTGVQGTTIATTTTMTSSANPSTAGQAVTFTATVAHASGTATPTGTVTFMDGTNTLGSGTLNNSAQATFTTTTLATGAHSITAVYGGDASYSGSTSAVLTQTVTGASLIGTTTAVTSSANPATVGQSVTFTATVTPASGTATPTGTVTFMDATTTLGTGTLSSGVATYSTTTLSVGSHSITAVYGGDTTFSGSTSTALAQVVNAASLIATTTAVTSSANPAATGQSVTFTGTVTPASGATAPTGTVTFMDGATTLGTGTLSSGTATFSTSSLSAGSHSITAVYGGDSNFSGSTSTALTQTIGTAGFSLSANPTTVTVTAGKTGTTVISLTPAFGFSQQVSFACSGLPAASTCSFSPATLTPTGSTAVTTTVTIATNVSTASLAEPAVPARRGFGHSVPTFLAFLFLGLSGFVRTRRKWAGFFCAVVLMAGMGLVIAGCGGSGHSSGGGGGGGGGSTTPTGTSTVTVTGTAGTLSQTTTFTLTVQ